ncbi:thiamine diphosphokinase [Paenibacillus terrigena]|uniref:thiamine diphosphokinase n=1 Tax=Paenibacillus terrigena TaxID=369333 RepID=UPI0028D68ABE|nr:thiamine diphosphokinase [Paenibacillus terrigena]
MLDHQSRIIIFSGGELTPTALNDIKPGDFIIGVDRGAAFLMEHQIPMHIAVGDFDSVTKEVKDQIALCSERFIDCDPIYKDLTDTEMALELALEQNPSEIVIYGALGTRIDHSLSNIHLLRRTLEAGVHCTLIDPHNEICIMDASRPYHVKKTSFTYVSLLPLSLQVTGVTLEGFRYPLHQATLTIGKSLSVSNELEKELGTITITDGLLLVMLTRD